MTSAEQANVVCSQVSLVRMRASRCLRPRYSQFASGKALSVHYSTRRLNAPCRGPRKNLSRLRGQRPLRPPSTNRRRQAVDILAAERAPVPLSTQQTSERRGGCARGRVPSCLKLDPSHLRKMWDLAHAPHACVLRFWLWTEERVPSCLKFGPSHLRKMCGLAHAPGACGLRP